MLSCANLYLTYQYLSYQQHTHRRDWRQDMLRNQPGPCCSVSEKRGSPMFNLKLKKTSSSSAVLQAEQTQSHKILYYANKFPNVARPHLQIVWVLRSACWEHVENMQQLGQLPQEASLVVKQWHPVSRLSSPWGGMMQLRHASTKS